MSLDSNVSWLEEKFVDCSVALALTLINESKENVLTHVETFFVDGCGDPFYNVPPTIQPKGGRATFVSRNRDSDSTFLQSLSGTSGVTVWAVKRQAEEHTSETSFTNIGTNCHNDNYAASRRHLVIMWSAPRNFYVYENTLSVGLTIGPPMQSGKDLFNFMYTGQSKNTFHSRFSCSYSTSQNSGNYGDNQFLVTAQIGGKHKDNAIIRFFDAQNNPNETYGSALMAPMNHLPPQVSSTPGRASVKCLVHYHEQPAMGAKFDVNSTSFYDYHLALSFDFEDSDQCVWICELVRKTNRKDEQGGQIFEWKDENSVSCQNQTKKRIIEDRKRLGLVVFRVGTVWLELADVQYWCEQLSLSSCSNPEIPICHSWIQSLASKLNLPNQQILELLSKGDNGWFGLDWLNSIKDVFEHQINEFKPNESEEWVNRFENVSTENEKSLTHVRIGGFEKLRMFKCSL